VPPGRVPPSGPDWLHEIKHDGYRLMARLNGTRVRLYSLAAFSRRGHDWLERFPRIGEALGRLRAQSATIDGEAVVLWRNARGGRDARLDEAGGKDTRVHRHGPSSHVSKEDRAASRRQPPPLPAAMGGVFTGDHPMPGKRVQFEEETWQALDLLARDSMKSFQELADEAFADLLKKHGRPTDLKAALRASTGDRSAGGRRAGSGKLGRNKT